MVRFIQADRGLVNVDYVVKIYSRREKRDDGSWRYRQYAQMRDGEVEELIGFDSNDLTLTIVPANPGFEVVEVGDDLVPWFVPVVAWAVAGNQMMRAICLEETSVNEVTRGPDGKIRSFDRNWDTLEEYLDAIRKVRRAKA
jgi:hypothetical protein